MSLDDNPYMKTRPNVKRRRSLNSTEHHPTLSILPFFETGLRNYTDKLSLKKLRMPEIPVLPGIQREEKTINTPRRSVTERRKRTTNASKSRQKVAKSTNGNSSTTTSSTSSSSTSRHLRTKNVETKGMLNSFFSNLIVTPFLGQSQSVIVSSENFSRFHRQDDNNKRQSYKTTFV